MEPARCSGVGSGNSGTYATEVTETFRFEEDSSRGFRLGDPKAVRLPLRCSPTFPSNAALIERATRFSVFANSEDSPEASSAFPSNSDGDHSPNTKSDPPDSELKPQRPVKRKESEKSSKVISTSQFLLLVHLPFPITRARRSSRPKIHRRKENPPPPPVTRVLRRIQTGKNYRMFTSELAEAKPLTAIA
ncbi:transcription factor bHLH48-like [Phalaenopsis equestris]|uniref:transcription factor bHLH48-like n=1 Tax=Phalaenopsis equestris TaxID=78828 RepID=UPI0009E37DE6|nr:transcription factor bHLH48-like [Phalaenopsis equestris]